MKTIPEPLRHRVGRAIEVLYVDETKFLYKNLLDDRYKLFMLVEDDWLFVCDWRHSPNLIRAMLHLCDKLGIAIDVPSEK